MMQALTTSKDMVGNSLKWAKGGTERIDPNEYLMRAMLDAAQLGGYATGIPVRPIAKVAGGIKGAVAGETEYPVRRRLDGVLVILPTLLERSNENKGKGIAFVEYEKSNLTKDHQFKIR